MHLQLIQTTSNIWYYESRKCFLQNSVINMMCVAMSTFAPLHYQLLLQQRTSFLKPIGERDV